MKLYKSKIISIDKRKLKRTSCNRMVMYAPRQPATFKKNLFKNLQMKRYKIDGFNNGKNADQIPTLGKKVRFKTYKLTEGENTRVV